jgi:hypothetical protein
MARQRRCEASTCRRQRFCCTFFQKVVSADAKHLLAEGNVFAVLFGKK